MLVTKSNFLLAISCFHASNGMQWAPLGIVESQRSTRASESAVGAIHFRKAQSVHRAEERSIRETHQARKKTVMLSIIRRNQLAAKIVVISMDLKSNAY